MDKFNPNERLDTLVEWRTRALAWAKKISAKANRESKEATPAEIRGAMMMISTWNNSDIGDMMVNKYNLSPFNSEHQTFAFWDSVKDGAADWLARNP